MTRGQPRHPSREGKRLVTDLEESADDYVSMSGILVAFFVVTLPLTMIQWGSFGSVQRLISVAVCALSLIVLYRRRTKLKFSSAPGLWIAYTLWILLSVCWTAASIDESFTIAMGVVLLSAVSVLMAQLPLTSRDFSLIRVAWIGMAAFAATLFIAFGERSRLGERTHLVLESGGSDPNEYAAYLILPVAYFVESSLVGKGWIRLLSASATIGAIYIIVLTGSRAGTIAALVTTVLVALRQATRSLGQLLAVVGVTASSLMVLVEYVLPAVPAAVRERLSLDALVEDKGSSRAQIWNDGLELVGGSDLRFLVGYGPNGAPLDRSVMHNHFLQMLVDGGLVGLIIFVAVVLVALHASWPSVSTFAATVGVSIMMFTLTSYANFRPAWAVLFMTLLVSRRPSRTAVNKARKWASSETRGGHKRSPRNDSLPRQERRV